MTDWNQIVKEAVEAPCAHCGDSDVSYPQWAEHVSMPVTKPKYVEPYLEGLTGPGEQHTLDPGSHCENPKCDYYFTPQDEVEIRQNGGEFTCPKCGWTQNITSSQPTYQHQDPDAWYALQEDGNLDVSTQRPANPGGRTNAGLTLKQMGDIGEAVVARMGELPGIGPLVKASDEYNFPIDFIVEAQQGKFGCEVKTNHSAAQQRFKVGGKAERAKKIQYCFANGLKPALIGVRLNFFTDRADIFFREGLTDTWVGNAKMIHVATLNFADLNPFKSPDPQAQAIAVQNANLPDQSEEDEFDAIFGPAKVAKQTFIVPFDVHELKVRDHKGNHTHTIKRCHHCGVLYQRKSDHTGHFTCPTCEEDVDADPRRIDRVIFARGERKDEMDKLADEMGWQLGRRTGKNERIYIWTDEDGFTHDLRTGPGGSHGNGHLDAQKMAPRMRRCMTTPWECNHAIAKGLPPENRSIDTIAEPGAPVLRKGQIIDVDDQSYFIHEIEPYEGEILVAVTNIKDGKPKTFLLDEIPPQTPREAAVEWSS